MTMDMFVCRFQKPILHFSFIAYYRIYK